MNNSTSTTTAAWPTRWPSDSFRAGPTALVILGGLVLGGVLLLIAGIWFGLTYGAQVRRGTLPIVPAVVIQLIVEGSVVALVLAALPRVSKFSLRQLGFTPIASWQVGVALLGAVAMVVIVEGSSSLVQVLLHQKHEQGVVDLFKHAIGNPRIMWFFSVFAIVIAPVMEETIFRVFLFNLGLRYGGFWLGAIVSGIAFGAAHGDLFVLVPLMLGGMILSYVYYRTRNAYASMITHGLFNSVTILTLIFAPQLAQ